MRMFTYEYGLDACGGWCATQVGYRFGTGLVRLLYGHSVRARLGGLAELIKSSF